MRLDAFFTDQMQINVTFASKNGPISLDNFYKNWNYLIKDLAKIRIENAKMNKKISKSKSQVKEMFSWNYQPWNLGTI